MRGFDRLKEQMKGQEDEGLKQTVEYLLTRDDMEDKYLKEEKSVEEMCDFIGSKGRKHLKKGWTYVPDKIVYSWAVMYYSLPNELLKIKPKTVKNSKENADNTNNPNIKNNVIPIEKAKEKMEKETVKQLSLFGGGLQ